MRFDWQKFIITEFKGKKIKSARGEEYNIDCIADNCPNPSKHMFINLHSNEKSHDKRFICHRCGVRGNWKAFLILKYKRSLEEILSFITDSYLIEKSSYFSTIENSKLLIEDSITLNEIKDVPAIIELPYGSKKLEHPNRFTINRNIPEKIFKKFNFHVCHAGNYKNRIIIPVKTNKDKAFIAYSQMSKKSLEIAKKLSKKYPDSKFLDSKKKKIKNPFGSIFSRMLFNYNNIPYGCDLLFVEEGVTDVIRTFMHKYHAVGIFHSMISEEQASLISDKEPNEVCIMLDSDIKKDKILKNIEMLKSWYDGKISYIKLKEGDPDDIASTKTFNKIISKRKFEISKINKRNNLKLLS